MPAAARPGAKTDGTFLTVDVPWLVMVEVVAVGIVVPLIDPRRQSRLDVPKGIDHGVQVDLRSLPLRQGLELICLLGSRHVQVIEEIVHRAVCCLVRWLRRDRILAL